MISHKHRCIFLHASKTAGSSIEVILDPSVNLCESKATKGNTSFKGKHWKWWYYKKRFPENFDDYFKFSFVRNPWARMVSIWEWDRRVKQKGVDLNSFTNFLKSGSFNDGYDGFLRGADGDIIVDFIGRFENLQEDFNVVCDKIGIPRQELPHKNKSKNKHYTEYYDDDAAIELVAKKYAKDIEMFGYEFGGQ